MTILIDLSMFHHHHQKLVASIQYIFFTNIPFKINLNLSEMTNLKDSALQRRGKLSIFSQTFYVKIQNVLLSCKNMLFLGFHLL